MVHADHLAMDGHAAIQAMENVEGIIDLTLPVRKHWRWGFHRTYERDYAFGDPLREEYLYMPVHCFTHIDPPAHATEGEKTIDQVSLSDLIGYAKIVDLSHKEHNEEITKGGACRKRGYRCCQNVPGFALQCGSTGVLDDIAIHGRVVREMACG